MDFGDCVGETAGLRGPIAGAVSLRDAVAEISQQGPFSPRTLAAGRCSAAARYDAIDSAAPPPGLEC